MLPATDPITRHNLPSPPKPKKDSARQQLNFASTAEVICPPVRDPDETIETSETKTKPTPTTPKKDSARKQLKFASTAEVLLPPVRDLDGTIISFPQSTKEKTSPEKNGNPNPFDPAEEQDMQTKSAFKNKPEKSMVKRKPENSKYNWTSSRAPKLSWSGVKDHTTKMHMKINGGFSIGVSDQAFLLVEKDLNFHAAEELFVNANNYLGAVDMYICYATKNNTRYGTERKHELWLSALRIMWTYKNKLAISDEKHNEIMLQYKKWVEHEKYRLELMVYCLVVFLLCFFLLVVLERCSECMFDSLNLILFGSTTNGSSTSDYIDKSTGL